jgi:predicted nuclease with RNAse H fold
MQVPKRKGRLAEQQLSQVGISCFLSNKTCPPSIRPFIYRGIKLGQELRNLGHSVIEVYPSATRLILFGDSAPPKRATSAYLNYLKGELPPLIQGLEQFVRDLNLGACYALLNAYTAVLHLRGETLYLGDTEEGLIVVPKYGENRIFIER